MDELGDALGIHIAPALYVARQATGMGGDFGGPHLRSCSLCGLHIDCESEESAKINFITHVGRAHPLEYLQATGEAPTTERMKQQEYLVREGFQ